MKKILCLMCLFFSLNANAEYKILMKSSNITLPEKSVEEVVPESNALYSDAIYYFKMDEIQNAQFKDEVSGNWVGSVSLDSASITNDSMSEGAARFVSNNNNAVFSYPLSDASLSNNFTVSLKYKIVSSSSYLHLLTNIAGQASGAFKISPEAFAHDLYIYSSASNSLVSQFDLPIGTWLDIVLVVDRDLNEARIHVNDAVDVMALNNFSYSGMTTAYMGFEARQQGEFIIDEYAIFDRVLTASEIGSL